MTDEGTGLLGRLVRWRRSISVGLIVCAVPAVGGCFGYFPLTRAVYRFNNNVTTGILRNLVFWAFLIIPVYSIATTIDVLVLNVLEFWLPGRIDESTASTVTEDGRKVVVTPSEDGREATLTVSEEDAVLLELRLVKVSDDMLEIRDAGGRLLGSARLNDSGLIELTDALGQVVRTVMAPEPAAL